MPDDFEDEEPSGLRKIIGERTTERDQAFARAEAAERQLAFMKAGIPDSPLANYFVETYSGDLSADAIKSKAAELGIIQASQEDQQRNEDIAANQRIANAEAGQQNPSPLPSLEDQIRAAGSQEELEALLIKQGVYDPSVD